MWSAVWFWMAAIFSEDGAAAVVLIAFCFDDEENIIPWIRMISSGDMFSLMIKQRLSFKFKPD